MPEFWKEHLARFCVFHFTLETFMHILCVSQNGPNSLFMRYFPQYSCFGSMTQKLSVQLCFPHFAIVLSQYGVRAIAESHSYCPKVSHVHKKSSIPLRFHLSSLSSDMFLLSFCDVCCMWEIICLRQRFHKFQHLFFLMFSVVRQAFPEKQPVFLQNQIWGLGCFHCLVFRRDGFGTSVQFCPICFFVSLCAFVFEYVFQSICDLMYIISLYPIMSLQNGRHPSSAWEVGLSLMLIFAQVLAKQSEIRQSLCFLLFSHHTLQNDVTSPLPSAYKMGQHCPLVIFLKGFKGRIQDCSSL